MLHVLAMQSPQVAPRKILQQCRVVLPKMTNKIFTNADMVARCPSVAPYLVDQGLVTAQQIDFAIISITHNQSAATTQFHHPSGAATDQRSNITEQQIQPSTNRVAEEFVTWEVTM